MITEIALRSPIVLVRGQERLCQRCGHESIYGEHDAVGECMGRDGSGTCHDPSVHHEYAPRRWPLLRRADWRDAW